MQNENASASLASISEVHELTELGLAAAAAAIRNGVAQPDDLGYAPISGRGDGQGLLSQKCGQQERE